MAQSKINTHASVREQYDEILAMHYFNKWHQRCAQRAIFVENALFDGENSSDESDIEAEKRVPPENVSAAATVKVKTDKWKSVKSYRLQPTLNPESDNLYFYWQFLSALALMYNACFIPFRSAFPYQTEDNKHVWMIVDYIADIIYLIDMFLLQCRRQFFKRGCIVDNPKETKTFYYKSWRFKRDIMSVFPTDLLYLYFGCYPIVRVNRLLKVDSYFEFNNLFEMLLKQAYVFRVVRTTAYLLYVIHLDACLYYYVSYWTNFTSDWGYNNEGIAYVRCYFWAFMNITTIGNVPEPYAIWEYILQLLHYFFGLFIFSVVIGQVRDSVQAASAEVEAYRTKKNACINYMQKNDIPPQVQKKVRLWFEYTWNTQKILNETALLKQMPGKMHTEIAINVHMDVLSKVEIFKECDRQLLYDLLIKLQPILYLPGDYVCQKGAVGREMYIITNGMVQVVGDMPSQVFASLYPGTAFGEISLLAVGGGNRRTANIYSPGYTTLFILYKQDLNEVLQNYPDAQQILRKKAKKMLNKDKVKTKPIAESKSIAKSSFTQTTTQQAARGFGVVNAFLTELMYKAIKR